VTRQVTYHIKEYTCKNCKKQLTINGNGQLIELSPKFKEINDVLERIHIKRIKKIKEQKNFDNLLIFKH
jgi:RNase P subunit RPR2